MPRAASNASCGGAVEGAAGVPSRRRRRTHCLISKTWGTEGGGAAAGVGGCGIGIRRGSTWV
eukprot:4110841-Alexandrium_andersonii.AAC.1